MEHVHRLHHRAVAAARRNAPAPAPALYNILARDGPGDGLSFPTDPIPPVLGQAPSSLIAPFLPPILPTINPLSGILPTIPHTDTPALSKPTAGLSSTSTVETHTPSSVLNTTSPVSQGDSTTLATATSNYALPPQVPTVVTQVIPPSPSTGALNNNNNNNNNNTSTSQTSGATTSSGSVATGVVVGLVGACAMVVFLVFLVRRNQRKPRDDFDATDFRRSAILMHDPPAHEGVAARGYNPRPPTMIERKMTNSPAIPAVTYGNNVPPPGYYNTASGPDNQAIFAGGQLSNSSGGPHAQVPFTGGQLMNPFVSAPPSPGSFATAGHSQPSNGVLVTPKAPYIIKPPPGPRRTSRPATGNDPGAANGFTFPQRQGSRPGTAERQQEQTVIPEQVPSDDYVDLSRSSVSPFQAAQYEAISRKLATDVPRGLDDDFDVTSVMAPSSLEYIDEAPPVPPKSPFEGPGYAIVEPSIESDDDAPPPVPSKSPFEDPALEHEAEFIQDSVRESYTSYQTLRTPELLDFPFPPSPALTLTSRHRIDSWPPTLPELQLDLGLQGTQPLNPIKGKSVAPKSSSPLAANDMTIGDKDEETGMPSVLSTAEATHKSRPETVYDPADAYGGI